MRRSHLLGIIVPLLLFAGFLRCLNFPEVFPDGSGKAPGPAGVRFHEPDSFYHLRNAEYMLSHYPSGIGFDYYCGYPAGTRYWYGPLLDFVTVTTVKVISGGNTARGNSMLEPVAAFLPVVCGVLSVLLAYAGALTLGNRQGGGAVLAALICAISPYHLIITSLGRFDHQVLEVVLIPLIYILSFAAMRAEGTRQLLLSLLAGITLALSVTAWPLSIFPAAFIVIVSTWLYFINRDVSLVRFLSWFFAGATGGMAITLLAGDMARGFEADTLSWFQPVMLFLLYLPLALIRISGNRVLLAGFILITTTLLVRFGDVFTGTLVTILYYAVTAGPSILSGVNEMQPFIVFDGPVSGMITSVLIAGIFILLFLVTVYRDRERFTGSRLIFYTWTLVFGLMALRYVRYLPHFTVNLAILTALFLQQLSFARQGRDPSPRWLPRLRVLPIILVSVAGIAVVIAARLCIPRPDADYYHVLSWLRDNTPATSFYAEPGSVPEYGVMSTSLAGNMVNYVGQRPAVDNIFHRNPRLMHNYLFHVTDSEETSRTLLRENNIRYVIIDALPQSTAAFYRQYLLRNHPGLCVSGTGSRIFSILYRQQLGELRQPPALRKIFPKANGGRILVYEY